MRTVLLARRDRSVRRGEPSTSRSAGGPHGQDAVSARLAELHLMRGLLEDATAVVSAGWVQRGWFTTPAPEGGTRVVTAYNLSELDGRPVTGACLVGAVVAAGGGPANVRSQLVQRTLDLTWHALREDPRTPVRWCPAPEVRMAHVRDLTRWNDHPARTLSDVVGLLGSAVGVAVGQSEMVRATPASS